MSGTRARLLTLLTALLVLAVTVKGSCYEYFCRMMDRAVAECCCAGGDEPRRQSSTPEVRARGCCERIAAQVCTGTISVERVGPAPLPPATAVAQLWPVVESAPATHLAGRLPRAARSPPALGPPRFLSHCALLI